MKTTASAKNVANSAKNVSPGTPIVPAAGLQYTLQRQTQAIQFRPIPACTGVDGA